MSALDPAIVFGVGFLAGIINTLAGGGSLLTLPLLVEMGMTSTAANATNRVAVWMQAGTSTRRFADKQLLPFRESLALVPSSIVGVALGAFAAARIDDGHFRLVLAAVFAGMGVVLLRRLLHPETGGSAETVVPRGPLAQVAMLGVGFYSGFVQAGVGVLIIWVLHVVGRLEIVRSNAVKVLLVLIWNTLALAVFAAHDLIDWRRGLVLGAGGAVGAWFAVGVATRVNPRLLVVALAIGVWVAAARFAGLLG